MSTAKPSALPPILKEYNADYTHQTGVVKRAEPAETNDVNERGDHGNSPSPTGHHSHAPETNSEKSKTDRTAPPHRESSTLLKERQTRERNERMFKFWEQVKEEAKEEETERLKKKIELQHELIRHQDELHQHKLQQQQQRYREKQEKEKADKQAKNDALQEICRESLDNDRREAKERQVAKRREKQSRKVGSTSFPASLLPELPSFQPLEANKDDPEADPPGTHHSLASGPLDLPESVPGGHEPEGFGALKEEDEASYFDIEDEELPWHHLQLYRMYGQQADYFLHPKIETEQKDPIPLNPKLRQIGAPVAVKETVKMVDEGRAGAATLWTILRNESRMRLLKQDSKLLSPDLRSAFGAFAREGLAKKRQPVKRNYSSDDVPDMARLMDQSRVHHAQDFRHKVELMFRSSQINQDRTKVLLYNNPPPDMNNQEGLESVERYMPSWMDDQWDKESELSYKKWLQSKAHEDQDTQSALQSARSSRSKRTPLTRTTSSQNHPKLTPTPEDWNFILRKSPAKPRLKPDQPKIFFLTEEDATVKGEFSKRRKEIEEAHHLPKSIQTDLPQKSFSAMAMLGGGDRENSLVQSHSLTSIGTSKRSPRSKSEMTQNFSSPWQPLSLGALIEYKDNRKALGQGTFNQGKTAVWPTGRASAAV